MIPPPPPPAARPAPPAPLPPPAIDPEKLSADVTEWKNLVEWIAVAKDKEMTLRKSIAERMLAGQKGPNGLLPEGTSRGACGGFAAKVNQQYKRELLDELVQPTLAELGKLPEGAEKLVQTSYKFSLTAYRVLTPEQQAIADKMLILKPAGLTLEITEPPK